MNRLKKALATLLMVCMLCPVIGFDADAASAELRFSDPSTTVGAEVEVTAKMKSSAKINTVEATLTYDASMLRFISGDNATGGNGTITLNGTGGSTTLEYSLKFQALKEGTTKIAVSDAKGIDSNGTALDVTSGSSAVNIGPGDPSLIQQEDTTTVAGDGAKVEVDGVAYTVTNEFSDAVIPQGFAKGEMAFEGGTCQVVTQEASGISAMYLTPADGGDADFFLYNESDGSFAPFEEVEIAQDRYVIPLRDDGSVKLPASYQKTTLTLNGKEFDTWQNTEDAEYYVIYALNADGQKELYQYDTVDKTYQRFSADKQKAVVETDKKSPKGIWGKILNFVEEFTDIVVIIGAALLLLLLIVLIIVSVKLRHRDIELDDLYDEYGIDMEEDEEPEVTKASGKKAAGKKSLFSKKHEEELEDEFEEFDADYESFEEDDFPDVSYEEDVFSEDGYGETIDLSKAFESFDDYDNTDDFDDFDDLLSSHPEKKRSHADVDDTFKMDIVDLD